MEKLKFEFVVRQSEDPKTNMVCITSITDSNDKIFLMPEHLQPMRLHELVMQSQVYKKVKNTLQKRHDNRKVWISLTPELKQVYMDEDGNMQFKEYLLQEITPEIRQEAQNATISEEVLTRILENMNEKKKETPSTQNLKNMLDKFVIQKFSTRNSNASQWLSSFENECARMVIEEDIKKIEALKIFLDDSCLDWYHSMLLKHTVDSKWSVWYDSFCNTYADKGWSPIRYAMLYKYRQGSLLEYALKKERLLLEINKSMDTTTLIDLIATGLPNFISDKIDRNSLKQSEDLFNNIRGLEHLMIKKTNFEKRVTIENKIKEKNTKEYKPCTICERENKGTRYHPESACWFKIKNKDVQKRDQIRTVNNSQLETELNEIDPKN